MIPRALLLTNIIKVKFVFESFLDVNCCFLGFFFVFFDEVVEFAGWKELLMHLLCLGLVGVHLQPRVTWVLPKASFALCAFISIINEIQELDAVGNVIWMLSNLVNCIQQSTATELQVTLFHCVPSKREESMMFESSKRANQFSHPINDYKI